MYASYEDAERDYIQSLAKLLNGSYHKVKSEIEQLVYDIGGIVGKTPVAARVILKPRADHHIELFIKVVDLNTDTCIYTLCSAPDFVYENLEKWVSVRMKESFNIK